MKNILLILMLIIAFFFQSCDERITPNNNLNNESNDSKTASLTSQTWQYNEVTLKGGGASKVQFSRPNSLNLSSEFSTVKVTYLSNGTYSSEAKSGNTTGQWQFLNNETQLALTNASGKRQVYDISVLSKEKFEYTQTSKKSDFGNDGLWATALTTLGLPATTTEIVTIFSMIPY